MVQGNFSLFPPKSSILPLRLLTHLPFKSKLTFIYLFIYFWLCWVFVSVRGLSPVAASGDHSSSRCAGLSLSRPLLLRSTGSRRAGSVVMAHGPSCSAACGIFPDQGSNPCPLHWQADSQPLCHQGSPCPSNLISLCELFLWVPHLQFLAKIIKFECLLITTISKWLTELILFLLNYELSYLFSIFLSVVTICLSVQYKP